MQTSLRLFCWGRDRQQTRLQSWAQVENLQVAELYEAVRSQWNIRETKKELDNSKHSLQLDLQPNSHKLLPSTYRRGWEAVMQNGSLQQQDAHKAGALL